MRSGRVSEEDEGECGNMSGASGLVDLYVYRVYLYGAVPRAHVQLDLGGINTICTDSTMRSETYLSISFSCSTLKSSSQPISMRI